MTSPKNDYDGGLTRPGGLRYNGIAMNEPHEILTRTGNPCRPGIRSSHLCGSFHYRRNRSCPNGQPHTETADGSTGA